MVKIQNKTKNSLTHSMDEFCFERIINLGNVYSICHSPPIKHQPQLLSTADNKVVWTMHYITTPMFTQLKT